MNSLNENAPLPEMSEASEAENLVSPSDPVTITTSGREISQKTLATDRISPVSVSLIERFAARFQSNRRFYAVFFPAPLAEGEQKHPGRVATYTQTITNSEWKEHIQNHLNGQVSL